MPSGFGSLVVVVVVAALAPIVVTLMPARLRLPQVVLLLVAGILVGPSVAGWGLFMKRLDDARPDSPVVAN